jgi:hypothetical protein
VLVGAVALVHLHKAGEQPAALGRIGGPRACFSDRWWVWVGSGCWGRSRL